MKKIYVPSKDGSDWQRLLADPQKHWKKGASAMAAAASWERAGDRLPREMSELLKRSGEPELASLELLAAIPEWPVSLPGGRTRSMTDVLALCRNDLGLCVVAVEAKVLEDFGPTVGEKRTRATPGQIERLAFLHKLLKVDHFPDGIRYQLLHRTASALLTAEAFHARTALMVVHAFGSPEDRRADFKEFCDALGAAEIGPAVFKAARIKQHQLFLAWCDGDERCLDVNFEPGL